MLKKKKFLIGAIIIVIALGFLIYSGFSGATTYYYSVSELTNQVSSLNSESIKVNGIVIPDSVEQDITDLILKFTITEGGENLQVVYKGVVPDTFKADSEVVVEGQLNQEGVLEAYSILTKCPSKYEPEVQG